MSYIDHVFAKAASKISTLRDDIQSLTAPLKQYPPSPALQNRDQPLHKD